MTLSLVVGGLLAFGAMVYVLAPVFEATPAQPAPPAGSGETPSAERAAEGAGEGGVEL